MKETIDFQNLSNDELNELENGRFATLTLAHMKRQLGKLSGIIVAEERELRRMERRTFEVAFINVCRQSLQPGVFQSLFAQAEVAANGGGG